MCCTMNRVLSSPLDAPPPVLGATSTAAIGASSAAVPARRASDQAPAKDQLQDVLPAWTAAYSSWLSEADHRALCRWLKREKRMSSWSDAWLHHQSRLLADLQLCVTLHMEMLGGGSRFWKEKYRLLNLALKIVRVSCLFVCLSETLTLVNRF